MGRVALACPDDPLAPDVRDRLFNEAQSEIRKPLQSGNFSIVQDNLLCLSDAGDYEASIFMAALLLGNEFGERDEEEARTFLMRAANTQSAENLYSIGQVLLLGSLEGRKIKVDIDAAIDAFVSASALGYAKASAELCSIYRTDSYDRKSIRTAIEFCLTASEQGDRLSEAIAADLLFEFGEYPGDAEQAVDLYFNSAMHGTNVGPLGLGKAYEQGVGVLQDYMLAHAWYNVASSRLSPGNRKEVAEALSRMEAYLGPEQVVHAQTTARNILNDMQSYAPHKN